MRKSLVLGFITLIVVVAFPLQAQRLPDVSKMSDTELLSRFDAVSILAYRGMLEEIVGMNAQVIAASGRPSLAAATEARIQVLRDLTDAEIARLMAAGVDLATLHAQTKALHTRVFPVGTPDGFVIASDSTGLPTADYSALCGDGRSAAAGMFAAQVVLDTAKAVWSGLSRLCDQVAVVAGFGGNTSVACIAADIVLYAAEAVLRGFEFCDADVDSAEIEGAYERLGHIHGDLVSAQSSIIANDNSNRSTIVNNDNGNRDTIINNDNSNKTAIISNDDNNKTAIISNDDNNKTEIITNDNSNRTTIVNNDNGNRDTIINNDNSNKTAIISNDDNNKDTIISNDDTNRGIIVANDNSNKAEIIANDNSNRDVILSNDNNNRNTILANDNANRDAIVANDNANRLAIVNNDNANRDMLIADLRALACDIIRLLNTPEGRRSSSIGSCSGQPGYPYKFSARPGADGVTNDLTGVSPIGRGDRTPSVSLETDLLETRMIPSYYLPVSRGGMIEQIKDLVHQTIEAQAALGIAGAETAAAGELSKAADALLDRERFVEAYRAYATAYQALVPKN